MLFRIGAGDTPRHNSSSICEVTVAHIVKCALLPKVANSFTKFQFPNHSKELDVTYMELAFVKSAISLRSS